MNGHTGADWRKMKKAAEAWLGPMSKAGINRRLRQWKRSVSDISWRRSASALTERMRAMKRLLEGREYPHPDSFFFAIEDLPYMGKEYWFLHFVVPGSDEQVVITAGRSQEPVKVNKTKVRDVAPKAAGDKDAKVVDCAAVCWMYSGKKEVFIDAGGQVGLSGKGESQRIFFRNAQNEMSMSGAYPQFDIVLKKGGHEVFYANARPKKRGLPWEMPPRMIASPIFKGYDALLVNYYFDFKGRMRGKPVKGRAYLQKVVAAIPLAPWNWVRLEFAKGATLDYFAGKPLGENAGPKVRFPCNDFVEIDGKRIKMSDLEIQSFMDGETRRWVLSGKNLFVSMESYSLQPFSMKQNTVFQYDEYLVRVKDFVLRGGKKTYTLKDLGPASGIIEDAYGYLL
ncbi:hypothetical protein L0Y65_00955 [Candidatus Micrarchaeota archaeon]|nr:hypothetical protein [Candidatus Micrarchaeota archaeon]